MFYEEYLDTGCCTEAGDGGCRRMLTVRRTPADWLLQTTEAAWSPQPEECGTQHDLLVLVEQIVDNIAKYHMQEMPTTNTQHRNWALYFVPNTKKSVI